MRPASPTNSRQPWGTPASTLTRARTDGGRTSSLYDWSWSANHSTHGTDTTRVGTPSASSRSRAATAICTSEPVPTRITSGLPYDGSLDAGANTYAPRATAYAEFIGERSNTGRFWRDSARPAG